MNVLPCGRLRRREGLWLTHRQGGAGQGGVGLKMFTVPRKIFFRSCFFLLLVLFCLVLPCVSRPCAFFGVVLQYEKHHRLSPVESVSDVFFLRMQAGRIFYSMPACLSVCLACSLLAKIQVGVRVTSRRTPVRLSVRPACFGLFLELPLLGGEGGSSRLSSKVKSGLSRGAVLLNFVSFFRNERTYYCGPPLMKRPVELRIVELGTYLHFILVRGTYYYCSTTRKQHSS